LRHQRCHPAQRRLLVREPLDLSTRVGVRDRGGDEVGELHEPRIGT